MEVVLQLISSVGFPIVACVYLFDYAKKQNENMLMFKDAINNNTKAIEILTMKLNMEGGSLNGEKK